MDPLRRLNADCCIYIEAIGLKDAQRKCDADVLGNAKQIAAEFNGSCGDFWAEIAAIRALKQAGYSNFRAIHGQQHDRTTSDYEASLKGEPAFVEVKNVRSNKTVFDTFTKELKRLHGFEPSMFSFHIVIDYPYDRFPTPEQERRIRAFLNSLRGVTPPCERTLDLVDAQSRITVMAGEGTVAMTRFIGPSSPEPLSKEWFTSKIRSKAEEAHRQMKNSSALKVLVINFDSPTGSLSGDFVTEARRIMAEVFDGNVNPFFLLYGNSVSL